MNYFDQLVYKELFKDILNFVQENTFEIYIVWLAKEFEKIYGRDW